MRTATALNNEEALNLCQHVIRLVKNPWDDPTLSGILQGSTTFSDDEGSSLSFTIFTKFQWIICFEIFNFRSISTQILWGFLLFLKNSFQLG